MKKKAGTASTAGHSKSSRSKNKKSALQNGRSSKMVDSHLQPPSSSSLYPAPSNGLLATNSAVSMPTSGENSSLFVGGEVLTESDQQLLLSVMSSTDTSSAHSSGSQVQTTPTLLGGVSGSRPHTPNPGIANSRSHTASPSTPDVQYRSFRLFVLSETSRSMEARVRLIKQWREEGNELVLYRLKICRTFRGFG